MSILDKCNLRSTRDCKEDDFISLSVRQEDEGEIGSRLSHQFGFILEGRIAIKFFANNAEYDSAVRNARLLFLQKLYGDILEPVYRAKSALFARDAESVNSALEDIINIINVEK
jgi:hypothetical protein